MRLRVQTAMVGLAAAMVFGCSTPPDDTGAAGTTASAGTSGGAAGTAAAGTSGGAAGTSAAGTSGGAAGVAAAGTNGGGAGTSAAGTNGSAGTTAAAAGTGGGGTAGPAACPAGVKGHCNAGTGAKDKYAGYTLALAEEFDTAIDLDADPIWTWSDGGPPEGQARFQKEGITFADGHMIITAKNMSVLQSISYAEPNKGQMSGTPRTVAVASGEFRTKYNNYRYGRYEVSLKAPVENMGKTADGNYLSTMFIFRTPKWSEWNEIDIELEANIKGKVAYNMVNALNQTAYPGGDAGSMVPPGSTAFSIQAFHTYSFEWTPTKVTWYVDGVKLRDNGATPPIPTNSAKIMMNLWVFASADAFGQPTNNVYPFHSEYDWFRFYKWNNETMYPFDAPKTQLPAGDVDFSKNNSSETVYP